MTSELHARAEQLIAKERVEGISQSERDWLSAHLEGCERCAEFTCQTEQALRALRIAAIPLPSGLASRTQFRVRLRAEELRDKEPARKLVWAVAGVSWALGVATAPWVWHGLEWIGQATGAPRVLMQAGFVLWWGVPALLAAGAVLFERGREAPDVE